jgi:hypothetical protein
MVGLLPARRKGVGLSTYRFEAPVIASVTVSPRSAASAFVLQDPPD